MKKDKIFEFNSNNDVVNFVINNKKDEDCILIKASNGMHFIEIVNELKIRNVFGKKLETYR